MPSSPAKRGENCNPGGINQRLGENKRWKDEKEIKRHGKKLAVLDAIWDISLARTEEELDTIFHSPQTTERLKDQTRYRLLVVEQKITLGGNKQALYDKLLPQLEADRRVGSDTEDTRDENCKAVFTLSALPHHQRPQQVSNPGRLHLESDALLTELFVNT